MRGMAPFSARPLSLSPSVLLPNKTRSLCGSSRTGATDCVLGLVDSFFSSPLRGGEGEGGSLFLRRAWQSAPRRAGTYWDRLDTMSTVTGSAASCCTSASVKLCVTVECSVHQLRGSAPQRANIQCIQSQRGHRFKEGFVKPGFL